MPGACTPPSPSSQPRRTCKRISRAVSNRTATCRSPTAPPPRTSTGSPRKRCSNALRHGPATRIGISLARDDTHTILEVTDNGIGFDLEAARHAGPAGSGMGLRTMDYRASLIGGTLDIQRRPGGGTLVRCLVPHKREKEVGGS